MLLIRSDLQDTSRASNLLREAITNYRELGMESHAVAGEAISTHLA